MNGLLANIQLLILQIGVGLERSGVSTDGLKNLERWKNAMYEQPGMLEGIKVPVEIKINENLDDEEKTKEFIKNAQKMVKK